ncbi:MAG: hypothetical protein ACN0LA_03650 [Candidatus Longimicrobiales bacterium M2_2A_002]
MKPEELERMIEAATDYNEPPETPREEMWAVIRTELPGAREAGPATDELAARRARSRDRAGRWTPWAVGLATAAMLAVGFGLGRLTRPPVPTEAPAAAARDRSPSMSVRLAAAEHMGDAEAMLTLFQASEGTEDRAAAARWARDLLATTRMLLDSRAAEDPELARLLEDLELVLVQIANTGPDGDQELIEEGIRQQQLLPKLRTAAAPAEYSL